MPFVSITGSLLGVPSIGLQRKPCSRCDPPIGRRKRNGRPLDQAQTAAPLAIEYVCWIREVPQSTYSSSGGESILERHATSIEGNIARGTEPGQSQARRQHSVPLA